MLKQAAVRASVWTVVGNSGQQLLGFLVFVYLARVLTPTDFGLMALAAAVIDVLTVFGRFGQVEALMQKGRIEKAPCSTSFWLICAIGLAIALVVAAAAQPLAAVFGEPQIVAMLIALAPVPLLQNLGQVHEAFLRSAFDYRGLALRNSGAMLISGAVSVVAAMNGLGLYALVLQKIAFAIAYSALVWIAYRWHPRLEFGWSDARNLARVGFDVVVANLINMLNPRIVDVAVGYFLGATTLGYLRIAWRLFDLVQQLIIQPVSSVAITSLTRLSRDKAALNASFLRHLQVLTFLTVPAFIGVGILAGDVIRLAAGAQWAASAPLLAILSLAAAAIPLNFLFPPAMVAAGRTETIRRLALLQIVVTAATMFVAAQIGIMAVLAVHVARVYLFAAINAYHLRRALGLGFRTLLGCLLPPVCASAAMAALVFYVQGQMLPALGPVAAILALGLLGLVGYLAAILVGGMARLWRGYLVDLAVLARGTTASPKSW